MEWVKQNLKFVIGMVVSLLLIGGAGFFAYTQYNAFNQSRSSLDSARSSWEGLENQNPHPGTANLDNIRSATNDLGRVRLFFEKNQLLYPSVPDITLTNAIDLSVALNQSIAKLSKDSDLYGVTIPNNYNFTFRGQKEVIDFPEKSSIPKYAFHLQNIQKLVKAIYEARVHSLEEIKRVRVGETDANSFGIMQQVGMTKEEFLLYTPYEISFKGFSSELANVIENLANSKDVYIVKAMAVEPTELPVRPQENRKTRRMMPTQMPGQNPYGTGGNPYGTGGNPYGTGGNPYGGRAGANPYGTGGNPYGGGPGAGRAGEYGGGASQGFGANPYGGGRPGANPYGGNSGNPYGGQYGGGAGFNPYNPYGGGAPQMPQIQTRQKEVSDKYVISENPLLFQVLVHMVHYFDDPAQADVVFSEADAGGSGEDGDDYGDSSSDDEYY